MAVFYACCIDRMRCTPSPLLYRLREQEREIQIGSSGSDRGPALDWLRLNVAPGVDDGHGSTGVPGIIGS
jgi:hypothetical protein